MTPAPGDGIINKPSSHSVDQTVERLKNILQSKGVTLFAQCTVRMIIRIEVSSRPGDRTCMHGRLSLKNTSATQSRPCRKGPCLDRLRC